MWKFNLAFFSAILFQIRAWIWHIFGVKHQYGYSSRTKAEQIVMEHKDQVEGKTVIVTGANSGLGKECTRVLAKGGARVIMAVRNTASGEYAAKEIRKECPTANLVVMECDTAKFASIRDFVARFEATGYPCNILINNAGIMACDYERTVDGNEIQFQTNYLGHFLLTNLLLPVLKRSVPARVVDVSSSAHQGSYKEGIKFDDLLQEHNYDIWKSYGMSKLANILHAKRLNQFLREEGVDIEAFAVHPGTIMTNVQRSLPWIERQLGVIVGKFIFKSVEQGAATIVLCAIDPRVKGKGGSYFTDCTEHPTLRAEAEDQEIAERLWKVSECLTNSSYRAGRLEGKGFQPIEQVLGSTDVLTS